MSVPTSFFDSVRTFLRVAHSTNDHFQPQQQPASEPTSFDRAAMGAKSSRKSTSGWGGYHASDDEDLNDDAQFYRGSHKRSAPFDAEAHGRQQSKPRIDRDPFGLSSNLPIVPSEAMEMDSRPECRQFKKPGASTNSIDFGFFVPESDSDQIIGGSKQRQLPCRIASSAEVVDLTGSDDIRETIETKKKPSRGQGPNATDDVKPGYCSKDTSYPESLNGRGNGSFQVLNSDAVHNNRDVKNEKVAPFSTQLNQPNIGDQLDDQAVDPDAVLQMLHGIPEILHRLHEQYARENNLLRHDIKFLYRKVVDLEKANQDLKAHNETLTYNLTHFMESSHEEMQTMKIVIEGGRLWTGGDCS